MNRLFILLTCTLGFAFPAAGATFTGSSGSVQFFNEASLHKFDGEAPDFKATFDTEAMTGTLVVQTKTMTTNLYPRDSKMRSYCLEVNKYPTITFNLTGIDGDTAAMAAGSGSGSVTIRGTLTIRDTTKPVSFPATYSASASRLSMKGSYAFKWTDFNIPDPSIIVSRLYPDMSVQFDVAMTAN